MNIAFKIAKTFLNPGVYKKGNLEVENKSLFDALPEENVLIIMNHTTYYMEAVAILLHLWKEAGNINDVKHKFNPVVEFNSLKKKGANPWREFVNGVARGMGMIYVRRENDKKIHGDGRKMYNENAFQEIFDTLDKGWVIFFPQGTTKKTAPLKPGILKIIKEKNPHLLLIKTSNFRECFGKKGVFPKKSFNGKLGLDVKKIIENPREREPYVLLEEIANTLDIPFTMGTK